TTVADVNGDGQPDLVVSDGGRTDLTVQLNSGRADGPETVPASQLSILLNSGHGTFADPFTVLTGLNPGRVSVADVNGDGKPDLVVADAGGNAVSVLLGKGDGTFRRRRSFAAGSSPGMVVAKDVTGDKKPDVVVTNPRTSSLSVLPGNGQGSL